MTDEELVKWLRNEHRKYVAGTTVTTTGYSQASDRIEALTAENEGLREYLSSALEALRDAGVCDDKCSLCNEAFAALEKQP
jgi:hypothetical protein